MAIISFWRYFWRNSRIFLLFVVVVFGGFSAFWSWWDGHLNLTPAWIGLGVIVAILIGTVFEYRKYRNNIGSK